MTNPTLSIVLINYNYEDYIGKCIESIVLQNYTDFELIVVDDGSTDASPSIIDGYAALYPKIRKILCPKNQGLFKATLEGIKVARGEFLNAFASDDIYLPGFLSKSMAHLKSHPELDIVCSDVAIINILDEPISSLKLLDCNGAKTFTPFEMPKIFKTSTFRIPGQSAIFRREKILKKYGWLDPHLGSISDWFLFQQVALFEGAGYIPEMLVAMRKHDVQFSIQQMTNKKKRRIAYRYLLKMLSLKKHKECRHLFLKAGLLDFIFRELFKRLLCNPLYIKYWGYLYKFNSKNGL